MQIRNTDVDDGSVKRRLDEVYQMLEKRGWEKPDLKSYEFDLPNSEEMRKEYLEEEMHTIAPWLEKYREEILAYYSKSPSKAKP